MSFLIDSEITYSSFVNQNLCRLCWVPIAGEMWLKSEHTVNDLYEKVLDCLGIDLHENIIPNKICDECVQKLKTFSEYKSICVHANEKLRSIFVNHVNNLDSSSLVDEIKPEPEFESKIEVNILPIKLEEAVPLELKLAKKNIAKKVDKVKKIYKAKRSPTYCNICHTDLNSGEEYKKHNSEAHGIEDNGTIFKCFGCDRRFSTRKARLSHERNFCRGLPDGYKCGLCNKYLQSRGTYEYHVRMHKTKKILNSPGFICRQCNKGFEVKSELDTHKLLEHAPVKRNYICEQCGQIFHRQDYLRKHRMIHGDIKNYKCSHCGYTARERSSLIVHIRKHTGERPYSCDLCDQKCVSSSNLLAHRRRHLGVKSFECAVCLKRFGYKSSLQDHMVSVHGQGDPINRHYCDICGAIFPRPRGLVRHLRTKHKIGHKNSELDDVEEK